MNQDRAGHRPDSEKEWSVCGGCWFRNKLDLDENDELINRLTRAIYKKKRGDI